MNERDNLKTLNAKLNTETEHLRKRIYISNVSKYYGVPCRCRSIFVGWITGRVSRKRRYY